VPALERIQCTRIVAQPAALDRGEWPPETIQLRTAPDELLLIPPITPELDDPHAIVVTDAGWAGLWLDAAAAADLLADHILWPLPAARPEFAQGAIADIPAKLWLTGQQWLLLVPAAYADDFAARTGLIVGESV